MANQLNLNSRKEGSDVNIYVEKEDWKEKEGIKTVGEGSIGFTEKGGGAWWGWSHRARYGFKIGYKVKKGDVVCFDNGGVESGFECKTLDDCKKLAKIFADAVS